MTTLLTIWFILTGFSLAYVTWHNITYNPVSWVQKLAWILVTAYTGPIGLLAYWFTCRTREGLTHAASTQKTWQQAVNSEMHCVAGDATGIILSAAIVYGFALPNGIDLIIEYISAFIVGLFVFQALMMIEMYNGDYTQAVRKTIFAETVSMNMVMVGMIPTMLILMHVIPNADNPLNLNFWFVMGMATIVGGITAYPINYWLVAKKLKHGCMTIKPMEQKPMEHEHMHGHEPQHQMGTISLGQQVLIILATGALLLLVAYITAQFVPIEF